MVPNRFDVFNHKNFAIYVLDNYAVHLQEEIRKALLERGYILVLIGGGVTGDIQINDTHHHGPLKAKYRKIEMDLMLEKLKEQPKKIPAPSRDEIMAMMDTSLKNLPFDSKEAYKSLGVTAKLDGSEDHLISDKIIQLVGEKLFEFRDNLMKQKSPNSLNELLKTITPPKGIRRGKNIAGSELLDCEGPEIDHDFIEMLREETPGGQIVNESSPQTPQKATFINGLVPLSNLSKNQEVDSDAQFLDKLQELLANHKTSKLFTPFVSQIRRSNMNARRSVKKRIEMSKTCQNIESFEPASGDQAMNLFDLNMEVDSDETPVNEEKQMPMIGEFWSITNGQHSVFSLVVAEKPTRVKFFEPSINGNFLVLNDNVFDPFIEDFEQKVDPPETIKVGKSRVFYSFE